jgi:hypothetical protein
MGAHVAPASGDVSAVTLPATRVRGVGAIVMASQAFEPPEGDDAGLATLLADEVLVTELEASALERMRGTPAAGIADRPRGDVVPPNAERDV